MPETAVRTAAQIRQEFINFFRERHGHTLVPSVPVVPHGDPTLLFANAGMNQFKDVFLGTGSREYTRAVNTQKCIRAGGKHNDLEDVGRDTHHHTFFEMLGNWSFGDYFKAEAIEWAWDLLTNVWGLEKRRLYATVFAGDERERLEPDREAEVLWKACTDIDPSHISGWGKKDNFWEMGETGPCGPCSEIHYDDRPEEALEETPGAELVNKDDPSVIEIWNLVFIQYNRDEDGILMPLPAKHVDTGMGFERMVRVLQGKRSNYDTDIWAPIFEAIRQRTSVRPYSGLTSAPVDVAYRVLADHVRCLTMALADGAVPSNEGRGYVLRRILRRAVRVARQTMGIREPMLCEVVPAVIDTLSGVFPELTRDPQHVMDVIQEEEEGFLRTLDRGLTLFSEAMVRSLMKGALKSERWSAENLYEGGEFHVSIRDFDGREVAEDSVGAITPMWIDEYFAMRPKVSAEDAFRLHDTFGFPIDLTRLMAEERGLEVDEEGYAALMEEAREMSRRGGETAGRLMLPADAIAELRERGVPATQDIDKYHGRALTARIEAIWNGEEFVNVAEAGQEVAVILNRTNHYAEQGGQAGDQGRLIADHDSDVPTGALAVEDTQSVGEHVLHIGRLAEGALRVEDRVTVKIHHELRAPIRCNHTGTHLLNFALREVLGEKVDQRGSLVAPDRLRFDFSSPHAMTPEEIARVEEIVNQGIRSDHRVFADVVPLEAAKRINGSRAVFGERYPDPVRVVSVGQPVTALVAAPENDAWRRYSIEFCGGTHVETTGEIKQFVITQEQALAAGVRRIAALTGETAAEADQAGRELEARLFEVEQLSDRRLPEEVDELGRLADRSTISAAVRHTVMDRLEALRERVKRIRKQAQAAAHASVVEQARLLAEKSDEAVIISCLLGADKDTLLAAVDVLRARRPQAAAMLFAGDEIESKVVIVASVPPSMIEKGLNAGDWVKEAATVCDGGGGGRPDMAQAGGKDPAKITAAIEAAKRFAAQFAAS